MIFKPKPFQESIILAICQTDRLNVFAGMGLGKTGSTLMAIQVLIDLGDITGPVLVIAPLRVAKTSWPSEASKWENINLTVVPITGDAKQRSKALAMKADVYTTNYENLPWLCKQFDDSTWPFQMVVADESTKLKSFRLGRGSSRAKAISKFAFQTKRWVNLSGTPAPNGVQDLWGQCWFIDKGERLGRTYTYFQNRYFYRVGFNRFAVWKPHDWANDDIQQRIKDVSLSIDAKDHFNIDEPIHNTIEVELPTTARRLYENMQRKMFAELDDGVEIEAVSAAAKTMKCLQMANGILIDDEGEVAEVHDEKLQALEEVMLEASGPLLVAYHFKHDLKRILDKFKFARVLDKDPKTVDDFNAGKIPMLLAHPQSAGHGLSLQEACHELVFFSVNWSLEEHQQIIERIGPARQKQSGHNRAVFIHYLIAKKTVDELVMERLATKASVQDILIKALKKEAVA